MDIWSLDKLLLFLAFFVPGFVSIKIYRLMIPSARVDWSANIVEAVAFGMLNFAVWSWLIVYIHRGNFYAEHMAWYVLSWIGIVVLAPAIWPIIFVKLARWRPIARYIISPIPRAWDYVFGLREPFWVLVNLENGTRVGGRFGEASFASAFPAEEQIYIEQVWALDENGAFQRPIERSRGIVILGKDISSVEFFAVVEENHGEREEAGDEK